MPRRHNSSEQAGAAKITLAPTLLQTWGARAPRERSGRGSRTLHVLLVDSVSTYRIGLRQALERKRGVCVVGEAETVAAALVLVRDLQSDLVVIDVDLPQGGGIDLCRRLVLDHPNLRVVMISHWDWDVLLYGARMAGAVGFLLKQMPTRELVAAIQEAAVRRIYTEDQYQRLHKWATGVAKPLASLAKREWEVLWQVAAGRTNREVAQALTVSENTVEKHVGAVLRKLQLPSRAALISLVRENHLEILNNTWVMAEIRQ
ncbi:MAG: response regulator [Anaerolineae bacterium]